MRACIVLFALLATPLVAGVSQIPPDLPGNSACDNGQGDENRSDSGTVHAHQGLCVPQTPPPPPTCGQAPAGGGTATITGQVFQDVAPDFPGLENWCVDLTGPERNIARPCVVSDDGRYRMWYSYDSGCGYRIGYAESEDGLRWTRRDDRAGISPSATGWDSEAQAYPWVFSHDGTRFLLYNGNAFGRTGFGLAVER